MTQYHQERHSVILYAEEHSAIRWPLVVSMLAWALLMIIGIVAIAWSGNPGLAFMPAIGGLGLVVTSALTILIWPTGIEITGDGIRVGGIRRVQRADRKLPSVDARWKRPFFCPWDAVRSAEVVTDRSYIRSTNRKFRERGKVALGMFYAPFTLSALFLDVDVNAVTVPEFRPPDTERPFFRPANFAVPFTSPVWLVPTRNPDALRAALAQRVNVRTR